MKSTLFHIPTALSWGEGRLPLFGVGLLTAAWLVVGIAWFAVVARRQGCAAAAAHLWLPVGVVTAMLGVVLPWLDDGQGVPVRGYGVMLLAAAAAGTWLSVARGRRAGIDADTIREVARL